MSLLMKTRGPCWRKCRCKDSGRKVGKRDRNMKKKAFRGKTIAALAALALVMGAVLLGSTALERIRQAEREAELRAEGEKLKPSSWTEDNTLTLEGGLYGFDHRIETFLFMGTDASGSSDPQAFRGGMADFLLLMVLDHTGDAIGCIQIDPNTMTAVRELDTDISEITSRNLQICTAHWYGLTPEMAVGNTMYAVRQYLGGLVQIDGYFVMSIENAAALNHAVGGVEVTIEDDLDSADPAMVRGATVLLNDEQVEIFLRARQSVGGGTNAERMARQRQYMASFFSRVKQKTAEDAAFGLALWNALKDAAVSDMNGNDFSRIAQKLIKGEDRGIVTVRGAVSQGDVLQDGMLHEEFYPDAGPVRDAMTDLFSLIPLDGGNDTKEDEA